MNLELAIAIACEPTTCNVQYLDATSEAVRYAAPVQDRIKVRPGDLVAVDREAAPVRLVWRWGHGTVRAVSGDTAVIERNVTQSHPTDPRRGTLEATVPAWLRDSVVPGATVYLGGDHNEVIDVAIDGRPGHPESIRVGGFPTIIARYAELDAGPSGANAR